MVQNLTPLRYILTERFSDDELKTLCFDLGLDYDLLPGEGKGGKARELLRYLDRRDRIDELIEVGQAMRPDICWIDKGHSLPKLTIPHNLPPRSEFVGRETEKARIYEALSSQHSLISIDGIGGIGKTSMALEVAYECLHASREAVTPDGRTTFAGFIWATARDRDLTLNDLLDIIARTLDYPGIARRSVGEKREAVKRLLQEQPYLLVVDNFETISETAILDFLQKLPEPSKALITTRERTFLPDWVVTLKGLTEDAALELIRSLGHRLGLRSLSRSEADLLLQLYRATGGAPLAIKWAVGQIKQRGQSLDSVLAALHEARGDLFHSIFTRSWSLLSPHARQVLMVLPLFATSASRKAIEVTSDVHDPALNEALGQLVEMSMIEAANGIDRGDQRYSIHPLTRAFALAELRRRTDEWQIMEDRQLNYYRDFAREHGGTWFHTGFSRLEPEIANILKVATEGLSRGEVTRVVELLDNVDSFMSLRGYWNDMLLLGREVVGESVKKGDELTAALKEVWTVGWVLRHQGNLEASEEIAVRALEIGKRYGDDQVIMVAKRDLGRIAQERGDLEQAEQLIGEVLSALDEHDEVDARALVTANLAEVALKQDNLYEAERLCEEALASMSSVPNAATLVSILGRVACQRGELQRARRLLKDALAGFQKMGHMSAIAETYHSLGMVESKAGRTNDARQKLLAALEIYEKLDMQSQVQEIETHLAQLEESRIDE